MKRFVHIFLSLLLIVLSGCVLKQSTVNTAGSEPVYNSDTSSADCYLCSGSIEESTSSYWNQDNIALISLNTFEIQPIEINRYDRTDGQRIEEYAGFVSWSIHSGNNSGFSASLFLNYDRGYASGSLDLCDDEILDPEQTAAFLCTDCLNKILPQQIEQCLGIAAIDLATKQIHLFDKNVFGFELGNFYIDCDFRDHDNEPCQMDILVFYCPARYEAPN